MTKTMTTTGILTAALLAATLAAPVAAWSQTAGGTNGGGSSTGGATSEKESKDAMPQTQATNESTDNMDSSTSRKARVEQRIADLHATLKIKQSQEKMFDSFAQVMLDNAQAMDSRITKGMADQSKMTAEQSLRTYAMITEEHAKNVKRLSTAFDRLYAELTPDQKMAADEAFRTAAADRQMKQQTKTGG